MWEKVRRYQKRLKEESNPDVVKDMQAIISGMTNFFCKNKKAREIAEERLKNYCSSCAYFISDPVDSEKVQDKDIPELSGKICSLCGCTSAYKLRQSIKKCEFWK